MNVGYYKSHENIIHTLDNLKEPIFKGEIINVTNIEEEYGGVTVTFGRFERSEQTEIFFAGKKRNEIDKFFQQIFLFLNVCHRQKTNKQFEKEV